MKKRKNKYDLLKKSLMDDITKTQRELETAYAGFQYASDPDLIDCYIYEINSADLRYRYLINQIKELSLTESVS
ncbi:MAG: DUF2508 family protein [Lachnospiraceae bacterium]|jgi:hypothetical protein